jgi:hypothetical protein
LITKELQSVADVFVAEWSSLDIIKMKSDMIRNMIRISREIPIIDPKSIYKEAKSKGIVETLVNYEEINDLSDKTERLYSIHLTSENE